MTRWLARREREGLSWAQLSWRSGHPIWRLRYWQRRLEGRDRRTRGRRGGFVAVEVTERPRGSGTIAITTPTGYRLEVASDVDGEQLRRVIEALEGPC